MSGDLLVGHSASAGAPLGDALLHLDGSLMDVSGSLVLNPGGLSGPLGLQTADFDVASVPHGFARDFGLAPSGMITRALVALTCSWRGRSCVPSSGVPAPVAAEAAAMPVAARTLPDL